MLHWRYNVNLSKTIQFYALLQNKIYCYNQGWQYGTVCSNFKTKVQKKYASKRYVGNLQYS